LRILPTVDAPPGEPRSWKNSALTAWKTRYSAGVSASKEIALTGHPAVSAEALAHFCFLLAMGSALVGPDLPAVDEHEWDALLTRLMAALAPPGSATRATDARYLSTLGSVNREASRGHRLTTVLPATSLVSLGRKSCHT
jgi:hypothetical protein